jgi:hypothetical protein
LALNPNPLPIPDPDQPADPPQPNDTNAWLRRAVQTMHRLATDEAYREEIDQIRMGLKPLHLR